MKKLNSTDYNALNYILNNKKLKKIELSKLLDITQPAIYKLVKKLSNLNLLILEENFDKRSKYNITINKDYKKIIGLYASMNSIEIIIFDLVGNILESFSYKINLTFIQKTKTRNFLLSEIEKIINDYGKENIAGIGISMQACINSDLGILICSDLFNEKSIHIKEYIFKKFGIECIIENNIHAMLYTIDLFYNKNPNKILYYNKEKTKGFSIMINNKIYKGANFSTGCLKNMNDEDIIKCINFLDIDTVILDIAQENRKELINVLQCNSIVFNELENLEKLSAVTIVIRNLFDNEKLIKL
ncbi:ROK family protein [Oceanivirga salmonicida]|uniref:ROK family protein n=1 Tax=Oceanivirga salmonicida TaxID=1769291 RepID=UPI00082F1647|nr:ROK family protein [Oceanivirga salmonicida]